MPEPSKHYFLTVLLTDKYLQSSLVASEAQGVVIKEFSEVRSYFDRQDLIEQLDKSLQQLGPDSQDIVETIFAFDHDWLENGELGDAKKPIVKQISEELSLDALGQFSIPEALAEARLIGDQGDSCLLLVLKEDSFDLIFLKHGQFLDLVTVGRSESIADDFAEALARVAKHLDHEGKYFPSKVLLTSIALKQKNLDSLHEQLVKVDWTKSPGFAQVPTIVVLETDYMIKSVSLSAGKVLAKEHLLAHLPMDADQASVAQAPSSPAAPPTHSDVEQTEPEYAVEAVPNKASASSFGISFNQNYFANKEVGSHRNSASPVSSTKNYSSEKDYALDDDLIHHQSRSRLARLFLSHKKTIGLGFAAGLLGLFTIFTIFIFFLAKVRIVVTPKQTLLQKNVTITLDPKISVSDFDNALLKATLQSKELSGQDVLTTTGIGLVGDKAKGKVTIYNKTSEEKELAQGTILSSNGIEFTTDETAKVPASVKKEDGESYGKVEVAVTAKDIGAEANFNKDTKLRVADYFEDKFSATALETFSGGSSREVRVVAQADQDTLTVNLSKKLLDEASKEFAKESQAGTYLVPSGKSKILKNDFSAKVGDETESLTLNMSMQIEAVKYISSDLKQLGLALLQKDLPAGYGFVDQDPSLMSDKAQSASNSSKIKLNADLSAKAVAVLDADAIKQAVLGKPWIEAQDELESNEQIKQAQIFFNPSFLSGLLRKLPSDAKRVIIEVSDLTDKTGGSADKAGKSADK